MIAIEGAYLDFDNLIAGDTNSRSISEGGQLYMMHLFETHGYDRTSRFLVFPVPGTLIVSYL
jgi:hypothetical protein